MHALENFPRTNLKQIPESELILNSDGSIYHLSLLPGDIAPVVITVGDSDRVKMVSSFFDSIEIRKQKREFIAHTGNYKGKRITVLSTGIGTDNIDIVFNELDALANINLPTREVKDKLTSLSIIRIGTSGALQENIPVDSFVFSQFGLGLDGVLNYYKLENTEEEKEIIRAFRSHFPSKGIFAESYLTKCSSGLEEKISQGFINGITASCPGFYGPQGRIMRFESSRPDMITQLSSFRFNKHRLTNFEMETGAMYGLARVLGHHCCSVNLIVANRITHQFSKQYKEKMSELIQLVLNRI